LYWPILKTHSARTSRSSLVKSDYSLQISGERFISRTSLRMRVNYPEHKPFMSGLR